MSKKYKIGQVLYIVSNKSQSVIPVQIQEINQRTTIGGEETIYMVMDPEGRGPHNLDKINGRVYEDASAVSSFLKDSANKAIDEMVRNAQGVAKNKFGSAGSTDDIFSNSSHAQSVKKNSEPTVSKLHPQQKVGEVEDGVEMVSVLGKDGKSTMQKTKVRVRGTNGEILSV